MSWILSVINTFLKQLTLWLATITGKPVTPPVIPPVVTDPVIYPVVATPKETAASLPGTSDGALQVNDPALDKRVLASARIQGMGMGCSGFYVKTSDSLTAPVYLLTNGHCVRPENDDPNQVYVNPVYSMQALSDINVVFKSMPNVQPYRVGIKSIAYTTLKGTDLAIAELKTTHADLKAQGIEPLPVTDAPVEGLRIAIFGYPQLLDNDHVNDYLQQSTCTAGKPRDIAEFTWLWYQSYPNQCKNIRGGSSGSPVISNIEKGVWGLLNTGTRESRRAACTLSTPCNWLDSDTAVVTPDTTYVVGLAPVKGCFDTKGVFNIALTTCQLEKPGTFSVKPPAEFWNSLAPPVYGVPVSKGKTLDFVLSATDKISYKLQTVKQFDRNSNTGFTPVTSTLLKVPFPETDQTYILSIKKANDLSTAQHFVFSMTSVPPSVDQINVQWYQRAYLSGTYVATFTIPPEVKHISYAVIPNSTSASCPADPSLYSDVRDYDMESNVRLVPSQLPAVVCFKVAGTPLIFSAPKAFYVNSNSVPH